MKPTLSLALLALTALLAGCSTVDSRIKERPEAFNSLPADEQERLRKGSVAVGDTPDMVYIAIGAPDTKRVRRTKDGSEEVWIYKSYYEQYSGTTMVGYHRWLGYDRFTGRHVVYYQPAYADVYHERVDEQIRVTFSDGKVSMIEQQK